jgi:hypothetical protein
MKKKKAFCKVTKTANHFVHRSGWVQYTSRELIGILDYVYCTYTILSSHTVDSWSVAVMLTPILTLATSFKFIMSLHYFKSLCKDTHTHTQTIFQYPKNVRVPYCFTVLAWWRVKIRQLCGCVMHSVNLP